MFESQKEKKKFLQTPACQARDFNLQSHLEVEDYRRSIASRVHAFKIDSLDWVEAKGSVPFKAESAFPLIDLMQSRYRSKALHRCFSEAADLLDIPFTLQCAPAERRQMPEPNPSSLDSMFNKFLIFYTLCWRLCFIAQNLWTRAQSLIRIPCIIIIINFTHIYIHIHISIYFMIANIRISIMIV